MSNDVFPSLPGIDIKVGRTVSAPPVSKRTTPSRREFRARDASVPRYLYTLAFEVLRAGAEAELQQVVGLFNKHGGSFESFLFSDPVDNTVTAQLFGTGNGSTTQFQLVRSFGGFAEPVTDIDATVAAPLLYLNGVLKTAGTHYSIGAGGSVTWVTAPGAGVLLTWTGGFYRRVRFERDEAAFERFLVELWTWNRCELRSVVGEA